MACEIDIRVQNEHAVRCSVVSNPTNTLEYIKTISSLVGASHVLAVFEERDSIKVFFDEKRHVDTLLRSCLHVMGRHVRVDYVVPPGVKLILSNVDPIISNYVIVRLLSVYGTVVSPIIRPPISDDIELCHISYGVRYVYMILNGCIPERVEFRNGDQLSNFKVNVAEGLDAIMYPCIKTDTLEEPDETGYDSTVQSQDCILEPSGTDASANEETGDPILVSVQSVPRINSEEPIESLNNQIPVILEASTESFAVGTETLMTEKKCRGRPPFRKHKGMTVVSQAAKRIKKAKGKWLRHYKKSNYKHKPLAKSRCHRSAISSNTTSIEMLDLVKMNEQTKSEKNINNVLDKKHLLMYIDEVKGHRAPLELARKYIGDSRGSEKMYKFIDQLQNFKRSQANLTLKTRIWRLVKTITDALTSENNQN